MKLNWVERLVVNNPMRVLEQWFQIQWFRKMMPLNPGSRILEVGCGRGAGARLIIKAFKPLDMHCQDFDLRMIQKSLQYMTPSEQDMTRFHVGDAAILPFKNGIMDAVFDFGIVHHVTDWRNAISEIARVLKPGGTFFIEELYPALYQNMITKHILVHPKHNRFKSRDFRKALKHSGLKVHAALENRLLGILAVAVKMQECGQIVNS